MMTDSAPERAMDRLPTRIVQQIVVSESGCWVWMGSEYAQGYGTVHWAGRKTRVHRLVYRLLVGEISEETLDHLCRNRGCVNPAHLEPVTNHINTLRGNGLSAQNARKTHCPAGHPLSGENLIVGPAKYGRSCRHCRTCRNQQSRAARARQALRARLAEPTGETR